MRKSTWVVMATSGDYSDRREWPVLGFTRETKAKDHVAKLTQLARVQAKPDFDSCPDTQEGWEQRTADEAAWLARTQQLFGSGCDDYTFNDREYDAEFSTTDLRFFVYEVAMAPATRDA